MTRAKNAGLVPTALVLLAGVLLVVLLFRAQAGLAPAPRLHQVTSVGSGAATSASQTSSNSAASSKQTITPIGSTAPISSGQGTSQQPISENKPVPGTAQCPSARGSGLPCRIP
jgi:hypothetical protein